MLGGGERPGRPSEGGGAAHIIEMGLVGVAA